VTAVAMIDRLVHHAEILSLKGDSYRLRDKDLGARPGAAGRDRLTDRSRRPRRRPQAASYALGFCRRRPAGGRPGPIAPAERAPARPPGSPPRHSAALSRSGPVFDRCWSGPAGSVFNRCRGVRFQPALTRFARQMLPSCSHTCFRHRRRPPRPRAVPATIASRRWWVRVPSAACAKPFRVTARTTSAPTKRNV
jgi:hypothetical protein